MANTAAEHPAPPTEMDDSPGFLPRQFPIPWRVRDAAITPRRITHDDNTMKWLSTFVHHPDKLRLTGYRMGALINREFLDKKRGAQASPLLCPDDWVSRHWQFYQPGRKAADPRRAVVLNCDLGVGRDGAPELVRVCLLDYFTGEVLLDSLVFQHVDAAEFHAHRTGITAAMLHDAFYSHRFLCGHNEARQVIFQYVTTSTIVIGHELHGDFEALRWIPTRVVDTSILYFEREPLEVQLEVLQRATVLESGDIVRPGASQIMLSPPSNPWQRSSSPISSLPRKDLGPQSLKLLAWSYLGRNIMYNGEQGHNGVDNALAARDLVDWMMHRQHRRHLEALQQQQARHAEQRLGPQWMRA